MLPHNMSALPRDRPRRQRHPSTGGAARAAAAAALQLISRVKAAEY